MSQDGTSAPLTGVVVTDRDGTAVLTITVPRVVARLAVVVPVVAALVALDQAAAGAPVWPGAVLVLLAAGAAAFPDSGVALVTLSGLCAWWLVAVPQSFTWWTLAAAGCVLAFHVAVAHVAAGPAGCTPTRAVVGRLTLRCLAVLLATAALAALVAATGDGEDPHSLLVALALLAAGLVPWVASRR